MSHSSRLGDWQAEGESEGRTFQLEREGERLEHCANTIWHTFAPVRGNAMLGRTATSCEA